MDQRDRFITVLSALLRAEREICFAFESCLALGLLDLETIKAIVSDPARTITQEDINYLESNALNSCDMGGTA